MNTNPRKKEENLQDEELRNHLYAQIEIAWNNNRNADLVDEFAFRYPALANELYEFFALLVEMELEDDESENGGTEEDSEGQLAQWLQSQGFEIALKAGAEACHTDSTSPTAPNLTEQTKAQTVSAKCVPADSASPDNVVSYDKFLRAAQKRENMKARQISSEINTPLLIITIAEENPDPQFDPLRDEISERYARRFRRDRQQARESFRQVAWAASTGKTTMTQDSIQAKVKKLRLPKAEEDFWLALMGLKK
ncbi:MAG TPA: hypothetical protein VF599_04505 [Pyrinomonadaceae bacterium]